MQSNAMPISWRPDCFKVTPLTITLLLPWCWEKAAPSRPKDCLVIWLTRKIFVVWFPVVLGTCTRQNAAWPQCPGTELSLASQQMKNMPAVLTVLIHWSLWNVHCYEHTEANVATLDISNVHDCKEPKAYSPSAGHLGVSGALLLL